MMSHVGLDPVFPVCGGASMTMTAVRTPFTTVCLILGFTELERGNKMSVTVLCLFPFLTFSHFHFSDLQASYLTWSPLGPQGPSHTPSLLSLMSFGKFHKDPGTQQLPHGHLRAWPTPSPRPRGAETPWASWLAGAAPTPQVCVCERCKFNPRQLFLGEDVGVLKQQLNFVSWLFYVGVNASQNVGGQMRWGFWTVGAFASTGFGGVAKVFFFFL